MMDKVLMLWTRSSNEYNPFINPPMYALMDKDSYRFLDKNLRQTLDFGQWSQDYNYLLKIKPENAVIVSNKIASKDSKYSLEVLSLLGFLDIMQENDYWEKRECPDFIIQTKYQEKYYVEITSTTSNYAWTMNNNCWLNTNKKISVEQSIAEINKQIGKAMRKKHLKINSYQTNTGCEEGYLVIHLSTLTPHLINLREKNIDINKIMPANNTGFKQVIWIDAMADYGILRNKKSKR